ncbi:MAG: gliding motility lipoprotein GldH [Chitinophagia bacterium]|nr:gliding motility lipoprotein GldH [Chitinophagia bacterium]
MRYYYFILLIVGCWLAGCLPSPHYQRQEAVPLNEWRYDFKPVYKFEITDTAAHYRPFFIVQHTEAYPFSNLWMWWYIKTPGDTIIKKERVEVKLAAPTGKWLGRGLGGLYEERVPIDLGDSISFKHKGIYEIAIEQNMRINPLPEILHVGVRVEKIR